MKKAALVVLLVPTMIGVYYLAMSGMESATRRHPYDTILKSMQSPESRANRRIWILSQPLAQEDLQMTGQQKAVVDELTTAMNERSKELWKVWRQQNPDARSFAPFAADGLVELLTQTSRDAMQVLQMNQQQRLRQLELQMMGWKMVHLNSVRESLDLSPNQLEQIKDLHVEKVHLQTDIRREASKNGESELLKRQLDELKTFDEKYRVILTDQQYELRKSLLGKPLVGLVSGGQYQ